MIRAQIQRLQYKALYLVRTWFIARELNYSSSYKKRNSFELLCCLYVLLQKVFSSLSAHHTAALASQ